jgi:hypothetical protein
VSNDADLPESAEDAADPAVDEQDLDDEARQDGLRHRLALRRARAEAGDEEQ